MCAYRTPTAWVKRVDLAGRFANRKLRGVFCLSSRVLPTRSVSLDGNSK